MSITLLACAAAAAAAKSLQLYANLCNPVDGSPPGSSIHGILQAKILEWVAISLLACEMRAIVWEFEHSLALPFCGIGMKTDLSSPVATAECHCSTLIKSSFRN